MYICGATVQGVPHIGHVRGALNYDVLRRWLVHSTDVLMVRNVTDIDDKTLTKAAEAIGCGGVGGDPSAVRDAYAVWGLATVGDPTCHRHITQIIELTND